MDIDAAKLKEIFERIDQYLEEPQNICVIGSTATILMSQPARMTEGIDVWAGASKIRERIMKHAVEKAGLLFDPKDQYPSLPYVQIVHPGIVQVPGYNRDDGTWLDGQEPNVLWEGEKLRVECPPVEALIASKMKRFDNKDIADSIWLMAATGVEAKSILNAIMRMPPSHREEAEENFDVLKLLK